MQKLFLIQLTWAFFGIAFTAFSVWLAIRIINRRERWAKRTAIGLAVGIFLLYPLSEGPATFAWAYLGEPDSWSTPMFIAYMPIQYARWEADWFASAMNAYDDWWLAIGRRIR